MKTDVDGKLKQIHAMIMSPILRMNLVLTQMWLAKIPVRMKPYNVKHLMRLGCVLAAQKIILFVSNSVQKAWISYRFNRIKEKT